MKLNIKPRQYVALLAMAFLALSLCRGSAALLCYEPFGPTGGLSTNLLKATATGTGFGGAWTGSSSNGSGGLFTRVSGPLGNWPRNIFFPNPSGGRVQYGSTATWTSLSRTMSTPLNLQNAGTYFISFLMHDYCTSTAYSAAANNDNRVFLGDTNDAARIYVGRDLNGANVIAVGNSSTTPWSLPNYGATATPWEGCNANFLIFVVARIVTDGAGNMTVSVKHYYFDSVNGWGAVVDPSDASAVWDATYTGTVTGSGVFNQLGISSAGTQYQELSEIRLGTTWADVANTTTPTNTPSTGLINVALGPINPVGAYSGAGPVAGSFGDFWNQVAFGITTDGTYTSSPQTTGPLLDAGGIQTGVTVQVGTNTADTLEWNIASGGNYGGAFSYLVAETVSFFKPDAIVVHGLDNTKSYNLYCFTGPWGNFSQCTLSAGGITNTIVSDQAWYVPWDQGNQYCIFTNVPTDGAGNLTIGVVNPGNIQQQMCGFQLQAVPFSLTQPQSQVVPTNSTVNLSVAVSGGSGAQSFQWQKNVSGNFVNLTNGGNILGVTTSTLTTTNVQGTNAGSYRAVVTVGSLVTNSSAATITLQSGVITNQLTMDTTSIFRNPFTGFALYAYENQFAASMSNYMQNAGQFWSQVSAPQVPYASTLYLRVIWSYMEPQEGVYVWNTDTNFMAMCQGAWARGIKVAFRIYVVSTDPGQMLSTPQWAFDAGVPSHSDPNSGLADPDITSPIFQAKYATFINAFGAKFNDPSKVMYVDATTFGSWGEGNVSDQSLSTAQLQQTMTWLMTTWTNALPKIPLLMNYPSGTWSDSQMASWCFNTGCAGMRRDGLGTAYVPVSPDQNDIRAGFPGKPFVAETASYLNSPADQVYFLSQRLYMHTDVSDNCIPVFQQLFDLWGGYRFVVNSVSYPGTVQANSNVVLQATVQNWGVGVLPNNLKPWNYKYKFAYALLDAAGNPVTTVVDTSLADDPSNWTNGTAYNPPNAGGIPTDIMQNYWSSGNSKTYTLQVTNNFGAVVNGNYYLGVAVVNTANSNSVDIALANTAPRTASGWTVVGPVVVSNSTPMTITTQPQPAALTNYVGNQVNYSVVVLGSSLAYQWYQGASPINGATNAAYTATTVAGTNTYSVTVSGGGNSVTSSVVTLVGQTFTKPAGGFTVNFNQVGPNGAYQGQGAYGDLTANTNWNALPVSGSTSGTAKNSAGSATLATFSISGNNGTASNYGSTTPSNPCFMLGSFAAANSGPFTINLSYNNVPPGSYNLYLYSQNGAWGGRGGSFSLAGATTGSADQGVNTAINIAGANCSLTEGVNYVLFTNVVPDATGKISITEVANAQSSGEVDFNGAQLVYASALVITAQPQPALTTAYVGNPVYYSVTAASTLPLSYQWYRGSTPVSGATSSNYTAIAVAGSQNYSVVVSTSGGSVTSSVVTLVGQGAGALTNGVAINFCADSTGLGAYAGQGAYSDPSSTPFWNVFPGGGATSGLANDSSNNPTLTTFTLSAYSYYYWYGGGGPPVATDPDYLLGGFAYTHNPTLTISYNNVPPGIYKLYLYAQGGYGSWRGGTFSLGAGNVGSAHNGISSAQNTGGDPDAFIEGNNYVLFTNVVPDAYGNITIIETNLPSSVGESDFNGAQLVWVSLPPSAVAPVITNQPQSQIVPQGATVQLSVTAGGTPAPTYRWSKNNVNLNDGATGNGSTFTGSASNLLTLVNARAADSGSYTVGVTNSAGGTNSSAAQLLMVAPATSGQAPWMTNSSAGGKFGLSFTELAGYRYLLQQSTNLSSGAWITISNLPPSFSNNLFQFSSSFTNQASFYRTAVTNQ